MRGKLDNSDLVLEYNYIYILVSNLIMFFFLGLSSFLVARSYFLGDLSVGIVVGVSILILIFGLFFIYQQYIQSTIRLNCEGLACRFFFKTMFFSWLSLEKVVLHPYFIELYFSQKKVKISIYFYKDKNSILDFIKKRVNVGRKDEN